MATTANTLTAIVVLAGTLGFVAYACWPSLVVSLQRKRVLAEGSRVNGWLVQANTILFAPGNDSAPALLLISFTHPDGQGLEALAAEVGRLKRETPTTPVERAVAALVRDETYRPTVRVRLPDAFTHGAEVYAVNVWIERSYLPEGRLTQSRIALRALPGPSGPVFMEPPRGK